MVMVVILIVKNDGHVCVGDGNSDGDDGGGNDKSTTDAGSDVYPQSLIH